MAAKTRIDFDVVHAGGEQYKKHLTEISYYIGKC